MPMCAYECRECGHVTAFREKPHARRSHTCEECDSKETKKVFSAFATKSEKTSSSSCPTGTCPLV